MMDDIVELMDEDAATAEALSIFEREVGTTGVNTEVRTAGHEKFLKFFVGRDSPFYKHALRETQKALSPQNPFRGALGLSTRKVERFPESLEATALLTLLTRSMRAVAQDTSERGFSVPYIPFQNQEDYQLAQPATHVIVGRRGVGKSTLIRRAVEILRATATIVAVIDLQAYAMLSPEDLPREILHDIVTALAQDAARVSKLTAKPIDTGPLTNVANGLLAGGILTNKAAVDIRRSLQDITRLTEITHLFFLMIFISWIKCQGMRSSFPLTLLSKIQRLLSAIWVEFWMVS
jgi:energy-coupling factor transporter ATP-binding protein EcfA2